MDEILATSNFPQKRWWWPLRHAYEIPDIVTHQNAVAYLMARINGFFSVDSLEMEDPNEGATATVALVLNLGEEGSLDLVVLNENVNVGEICTTGATRLLTTEQHRAIATKLGPKVITKVCDYARRHPMEAEHKRATDKPKSHKAKSKSS